MAAPEPVYPLSGPGGTPAPPTPAAEARQAAEGMEEAQVASFAALLSEAELALLAGSLGNEEGGGSAAAPLSDTLPLIFEQTAAALLGSAAAKNGLSAPAPASSLAAAAPIGQGPSEALGERIVRIAEGQAGQHEEPLGSNEGPAVARYRAAVRGAIPGAPWCAYFVSWVAREAGVPLGNEGQGLGSVSEIWEWAQEHGKAIPNGPGVVPKPGDLIVFGSEHVGIVRGVEPNGAIETVEGNYENKVALNVRSPGEPTGYVEL